LKFPADAPVTPKKKAELLERIERLQIDLAQVEEQFVRGSGPGGQKINKTASTVVLRYPPFNLVVRCSRERSQAVNRFLALRELLDQIELRVSPETSERLKERDRIRRRKSKHRRRPSPETPTGTHISQTARNDLDPRAEKGCDTIKPGKPYHA